MDHTVEHEMNKLLTQIFFIVKKLNVQIWKSNENDHLLFFAIPLPNFPPKNK